MLNGKVMIDHLAIRSVEKHRINEWIFSRSETFRR